jgi:predicted RNA binding protein YcfA (HicA-like mRNA interferase family)
VSKTQKLCQKLLRKPKDLRFSELVTILNFCGYELDRTKGSHAIFIKDGYPILTIPRKDPVKSYLIKQVLTAIEDIIEE